MGKRSTTSAGNSRPPQCGMVGASSPSTSIWASAAPRIATVDRASTRCSTALPDASSIQLRAWSVDRLGRSLQDLVTLLGEVHAKSIDLYLYQQGIDTTTPAGKALFQMMGVFAEFEHAMIRERVNAGLARARASGKRLGRPRVGDAIEAEIRAALASGKGMREIARELKVGTSTVQRVKAAIATA
jgi:hypothetical protein